MLPFVRLMTQAPSDGATLSTAYAPSEVLVNPSSWPLVLALLQAIPNAFEVGPESSVVDHRLVPVTASNSLRVVVVVAGLTLSAGEDVMV